MTKPKPSYNIDRLEVEDIMDVPAVSNRCPECERQMWACGRTFGWRCPSCSQRDSDLPDHIKREMRKSLPKPGSYTRTVEVDPTEDRQGRVTELAQALVQHTGKSVWVRIDHEADCACSRAKPADYSLANCTCGSLVVHFVPEVPLGGGASSKLEEQ